MQFGTEVLHLCVGLAYPPVRNRGLGTVGRFLLFVASALLSIQQASAASVCSGEACAVVAMSGDGCAWTNRGEKSVRLSLIASQATLMVTILAPGETFKQPDKTKCFVASSDRRFEASYPALRVMPEESVSAAKPLPRAKPKAEVAASAPPPAAMPVTVAEVVPTTAVDMVAGPVLPRSKPAPPPVYPPAPRAKPQLAQAPELGTAVAPTQAVASSAPVAASESRASCAEGGCPPILFKMIDSCVWVLNLNPRPVAFEATVAGRKMGLALEAADGAKADERASALAGGKASKSDAALHMRLHDPFQSAGSGIPIYRARLGGADACVKERSEISAFTARYLQ